MTTLLQIKPYIHCFIEDKLDPKFEHKVYWIGERKNVPEYPYCLLNVIAENKDKRTSHHIGNINDEGMREDVTTRYKTCTITVGIYNGWTEENDIDMDEAEEFAYEQIDYLEGEFENFPINKMFSVQKISPIRPLPEVVDGGYMYRYEFDLTIGYNEARAKGKNIGSDIEVAIIDTNESDTSIHDDSVYIDGEDALENDLDKDYYKNEFIVTIDGNDNIEIENNIRS